MHGAHSYVITDGNGCSSTASTTITEPAALSITGAITNTICGSNIGAITTSVTGGTAGYSYLWNNGATTSSISGLGVNTYSLTVTDAHSCTAVYSGSVSLPPRTVTVKLINSTGTGIAGATVQYYNGSWLTMGTTDANGKVCMTFPTPTFSSTFTTYFQVNYGGGSKIWSGVAVASNPVLVATTTNVALNLKDHNGALITSESGTAGFYNGYWTTLGSTGSNGVVGLEILPGYYYFNMNFHNYTQQVYVTVGAGPSQDVNFQTTLVSLNLKDHNGTLITAETGTGGYYFWWLA
jgi:hypothetical protein